MYDFIDKIIYINLDSRTDRRKQIEEELNVFPKEKVERFAAIYDSFGAIGCSKSHITVLEYVKTNKWKNVLIIEDDMIWKNFSDGIKQLENLVNEPYDVILLGSTYATYNQNRVISAQTTTAYLVNNHYYDKLLENFKEGHNLLKETWNLPEFSLDQYWKKLQATDTWYLIKPSMSIQSPSYSDIEKKNVDYSSHFT